MDGTPTIQAKKSTLDIKSAKTNIASEDATAQKQLKGCHIISATLHMSFGTGVN